LSDGTVRLAQDIADEPGDWVADVEDRLGPVSVLVNNVARMDGRSFLELPMEDVRASLDVTLLGTWALTKSVVHRMVEHGGGGSVVFNLSLHSRRVRMCPDYSTAKAALSMLVAELASELGPHGIRVNSVSPGAVDTWSDSVPDAGDHRARSEAMVPAGRLGEPDDVAKVVAFLADPASSGYVTGTDVKVDGGLDEFNWIHHLYGSAQAERERTRPDQRGGGVWVIRSSRHNACRKDAGPKAVGPITAVRPRNLVEMLDLARPGVCSRKPAANPPALASG
jgi:3-oxoacyl-[acyl-carrier protein] reductase